MTKGSKILIFWWSVSPYHNHLNQGAKDHLRLKYMVIEYGCASHIRRHFQHMNASIWSGLRIDFLCCFEALPVSLILIEPY